MGPRPNLNYDDIDSLLEYAEGTAPVILPDANILRYAYDKDAPHHLAAAQWMKHLFDGSETIGLPWITLWAFERISTNSRAWTNPKTAKEAFHIVREWLALPGVVVAEPGPRHTELLERLVIDNRAWGPLTTDAGLAALAIDNGAVLASTDPRLQQVHRPATNQPDPVAAGSNWPFPRTFSTGTRRASSPAAAAACRLRN